MLVLGCDLGGTNVRVRLARCVGETLQTVAERHYLSPEHDHLDQVLEAFLRQTGTVPESVAWTCIALAGPVEHSAGGQRAELTNLPWVVESGHLRERFRLPAVELLNDFEAIGYALTSLPAQEILTLQPGEPLPRAPKAVLGAGTGLGQALLVWCDAGYEVIATQGGHCDFAPVDDLELALLEALTARLGRVSYESVLSGPGLVRIADFLARRGPHVPGPALEAESDEDMAAAIGRAAVAGTDALAQAAVEMFLAIYGSQAGNLALNAMARGGVYIAGGIAPKLRTLFETSPFLPRFRAKGPMGTLMERFPVHLVLNPELGLEGATRHACARAARRV